MKQMMVTRKALTASLAALLIASSLPVVAANSPRSMTIEEAKTKTFSLKRHEARFSLYHEQMTAEGRQDELSEQFLAVHEGMKNGNYHFDLDTARKVMQEVYPERAPDASPQLFDRLNALQQRNITEPQN